MARISSVCAVRAAAALQRLRVAWYRSQWTCRDLDGAPILRAPALLVGEGRISFARDVVLGWELGPAYRSGYSYVEARGAGSSVSFGERTQVNNAVTIVSEGPGIAVGKRCLLGPGVHIYDSDFHALQASLREQGSAAKASVEIGDDVFIGTNAIILKGARLGAGSVVGAGAVVSGVVPAGAVVAGNPARIVER